MTTQVQTQSTKSVRISRKGYADYKIQPELSKTARIAHFLDWAAQNMPKESHFYHIIAKVINGYDRTPRRDSEETISVRRLMSSAKVMLLKQYGRGAATDRSAGQVRATVSAEDMVENDLKGKASRVVSAVRSMERVSQAVSTTELQSTASGRQLMPFVREVRATLRDVTVERVNLLLPPKSDT